jgi:hypothetical protein
VKHSTQVLVKYLPAQAHVILPINFWREILVFPFLCSKDGALKRLGKSASTETRVLDPRSKLRLSHIRSDHLPLYAK